MSKLPRNQDDNRASVLYVEPCDAKKVKNILETLGLLDKTFRMTKTTISELNADTSMHISERNAQNEIKQSNQLAIAVPVTEACWKQYDEFLRSQKRPNEFDGTTSPNVADSWFALVLGHARIEMPLSTGQFARGIRKKDR